MDASLLLTAYHFFSFMATQLLADPLVDIRKGE
jgi:hypothetical protein